jgi:prevent-host-death family protein
MERIGVRELQQHASKYIDLARSGVPVEVTIRGALVARLIPAAPAGDPSVTYLAEGTLLSADEPGNVLDVLPAEPDPHGESVSEALTALRDEDRW